MKERPLTMSLPVDAPAGEAMSALSRLCVDFCYCLYSRAEALFELTDAILCADGPVKTLVELCLAVEHRRGHEALYTALERGWLEPTPLRCTLAGLPLPKSADGRIVLAVDITNWCRPDVPTSDDRLCCHVYGAAIGVDLRAGPSEPVPSRLRRSSQAAELERRRSRWCRSEFPAWLYPWLS